MSAVNVVLTPAADPAEVVGRNGDSGCEDGWDYADGGQSIELCENTCLRLREDTSSGIELLFGCETVDGVVQ